jgi:hypothetical protein
VVNLKTTEDPVDRLTWMSTVPCVTSTIVGPFVSDCHEEEACVMPGYSESWIGLPDTSAAVAIWQEAAAPVEKTEMATTRAKMKEESLKKFILEKGSERALIWRMWEME